MNGHRFLVTAYDDGLAELYRRVVDLQDAPVRLEGWAGLVVVPNVGHMSNMEAPARFTSEP